MNIFIGFAGYFSGAGSSSCSQCPVGTVLHQFTLRNRTNHHNSDDLVKEPNMWSLLLIYIDQYIAILSGIYYADAINNITTTSTVQFF